MIGGVFNIFHKMLKTHHPKKKKKKKKHTPSKDIKMATKMERKNHVFMIGVRAQNHYSLVECQKDTRNLMTILLAPHPIN
jgi:hypothetical protein